MLESFTDECIGMRVRVFSWLIATETVCVCALPLSIWVNLFSLQSKHQLTCDVKKNIFISNHTCSEAMHNVALHQLPQFYQIQHCSSHMIYTLPSGRYQNIAKLLTQLSITDVMHLTWFHLISNEKKKKRKKKRRSSRVRNKCLSSRVIEHFYYAVVIGWLIIWHVSPCWLILYQSQFNNYIRYENISSLPLSKHS